MNHCPEIPFIFGTNYLAMEELLIEVKNYFMDMPTKHRSILLVGGLALFMILEQGIPFFEMTYNRTKHTLHNLFFTLTTILVNLPLAFLLLETSRLVGPEHYNFGVLNWIEMDLWLQMLVGLMLMDFIGAWLIHFIEHKIKVLWQFHVIHHTDQHVDTTSGNRHHPGESVFRFIFTALAIIVTGAPIWLVFFYQTMSLILTQFNHSNIRVPKWLDSFLVLFFCTPDMHRVHHHHRQPYSDSNYGNIFSFWDRIFGTYVKVDNEKLVYGVDTYPDAKDVESIGFLLKLPFVGYRKMIEYEKEEKL